MKNNEIIDAFEFRHACKAFDFNKKITDEDFSTILEAARLSPSSFGFEPWHFLVVQDLEVRKSLLTSFWGGQGQIPSASNLVLCLVKKSHFMKYDSEFIEHMMRDVQKLPDNIVQMKGDFYKNFQIKDFDLLSSERAMTDWAACQCYIALGNMMTVAALLGIDSCPMEGFTRSEMDLILAEKFNIDLNEYTLGYAVAFGYRVSEPHPKTRQSLEDIVTWI